MAEHRSSPEVWDAYTQLWRIYYRFQPENDRDKIWYTQSITKLNDLGDQRRLRLLSSRSGAVPVIVWVVLLATGGITIGFSFLFGMRSVVAQVVMSAGLAITIALVCSRSWRWNNPSPELPAWGLRHSSKLRICLSV
jgi:hypothetical protein